MKTYEKQIAEMAKVIMDAVPETIQYVQAPANETEARIEAKALYAAGYCKQSDTVREFTNKINLIECKMFHEAHDIRSSCIEKLDYTKPQDERVWGQKMECDGKMFALQKLMTEIEHIAAEYGVEVEE